ncbi:hypothetical protein MWU75_14420 [Ornithinimicrobium sp. F0845]|uniref:hypothetical protein n=1 Tax=Ornithinimicrobium sp. F0845 TaxID=2926412 RepID=UPI001FF5D2D5|nr:hypothetical protein [Ornithinimicrobium sp. F0845]MCK0113341.1 hypothetical protein [Ornithinimicrobium sp. F0845]
MTFQNITVAQSVAAEREAALVRNLEIDRRAALRGPGLRLDGRTRRVPTLLARVTHLSAGPARMVPSA